MANKDEALTRFFKLYKKLVNEKRVYRVYKKQNLVIEESIYVVFDEPNCLILYM